MRYFAIIFVLFSNPILGQEFDAISYLERNHNEITDSILAEQLLNSLETGEEDGICLFTSNIVYSTDGSFVIFQIEGEGCGAYCNPYFEMYYGVYNPKTEKYVFYDNHLSLEYQIEEIIKITSNHYLILGSGFGRCCG